ncbi:hypothetical protein ZWY2020_033260 [Hordeum vulgare]|nr:hypothetical protein ZWY2020_033260 [Hordeum vulgare]
MDSMDGLGVLEVPPVDEVLGVLEVHAIKEVLGVLEVPAVEEVLGMLLVPAVEEVLGVLEVLAVEEVLQELEVEGPVEDEVSRRHARVCIHPTLCRKYGIRGEPSIFLCLGCRLLVPKDLPSCELCGNPMLCDNYWCKDSATTVVINKDGVCIRCRRNPSIYLNDEKKVQNVTDSQV